MSKTFKNPQWTHLNNNLKSAAESWSELQSELVNHPSPDEQRMHEIKNLLKELQEKISFFSQDEEPLEPPRQDGDTILK